MKMHINPGPNYNTVIRSTQLIKHCMFSHSTRIRPIIVKYLFIGFTRYY